MSLQPALEDIRIAVAKQMKVWPLQSNGRLEMGRILMALDVVIEIVEERKL